MWTLHVAAERKQQWGKSTGASLDQKAFPHRQYTESKFPSLLIRNWQGEYYAWTQNSHQNNVWYFGGKFLQLRGMVVQISMQKNKKLKQYHLFLIFPVAYMRHVCARLYALCRGFWNSRISSSVRCVLALGNFGKYPNYILIYFAIGPLRFVYYLVLRQSLCVLVWSGAHIRSTKENHHGTPEK